MRKFILAILACATLQAQAQNELIPPKFQGSDVQRFMQRLQGEAEKVVDETDAPAAELSAHVGVAFEIDTVGLVTGWRFLDNTCEGADRRDIEPATPRTREVLTQAVGRLETWTPAERNNRPVTFTYRLTLRLPLEKIARKQDGAPLKFMGADPSKTFHDWATVRTHYDRRFTDRGVEGLVHIRFYIEPDGKITIGEVVASPDEKLSKEVIRVIRSSKGKWTSRYDRNGTPQRAVYDYRVNFHNF